MAFSRSSCESSQYCPIPTCRSHHLSRRWIDDWQCCASCLWASSWPRRSSCSCALSCRSLCEARSSCRYPDSCSRSLAASSWEDSSLRHSSCRGKRTHSEHQQPSRAPQFSQKGLLTPEAPSQALELSHGQAPWRPGHQPHPQPPHQGRL